ncbi:unnamed protein product [Psylliodes chrysocephalus]|uniref:Apple domain-containing protein n=1 Tax=Psylliodes chrysocephalus TaxID=3402493 RepID=A0A9P0D7R8_9CUCU|nr:unnamed protein product [Psylliodes chrysocephala]
MKVFDFSVIFFIGYFSYTQTTIIIVEDAKACFRRVMAGKRISRGLVRRALICESLEDCQTQCADEKIFICEGFNYRLDPSGRGKGDCELLSVPLSRIDVYRDTYPEPDYDYYERDRNAAALNCRQRPSGYKYNNQYNSYNGYNDYDDYRHGIRDTNNPYGVRNRLPDRRYDYEAPRRPLIPAPYRQPERWPDDYYRPRRPEIDRRYDSHSYDYGNRPNTKRRGDFSYLPQTTHFFNEHDRIDNRRYSAAPLLPPQPVPFDQKPYDSFPSINYYKYQKDRWDIDTHRYGETHGFKPNAYLPPRKEAPNDWGLYHKYKNNYSYWGLNKYGGGSYLPPDPALTPPEVGSYIPVPKPVEPSSILVVPDSSLLPIEHRRPTYNYIQDECSLRSVTGFKLHKRIVKKYFAVPNIYECELLCFKEKDFPCASYAYRYTVTVSEPSENCYLSNVDYKELDNYTDLEPDRDFDVYTMNNRNKCEQPLIQSRESSDCFWRVRSGERLHDKIVRDSLKANSIVDCQIECLKSKKFTCRAFSYRYGPHTVGGLIDNCQLTDWPYYELNPSIHFILEPGFEIYERGSFGHGCETGHFGIKGHHEHKPIFNPDQLCYIGFGSPARLLPHAIKKSVRVFSELECREECSKSRLETLFQCMSFSFRANTPGTSPNCDLSDIYQRDLLPKLDYVYDPHSLLFAWDNYNPDCVILGDDSIRTNHITNGLYDRDYLPYAMDTWRVYSVSGWPCKRGARCQENLEAGFWFCELEGGVNGAWDYCCRPEHQCGASNGYPYLWCYVGPERSQWRKCSEKYYPYLPETDKIDDRKHFSPNPHRQPWRPPIFRPDRPPGQHPVPPPALSLDQYEMIFNEQFLEPPLPGGIGQPRHWPVSYLHKEMPPNMTESKLARMETEDTKYAAIQNLINTIKNNDLKNIQYHISNESNKKDDILFVKIPLPTNFTNDNKEILNNSTINLQPITVEDDNFDTKRYQKSLPPLVNWNTKDSALSDDTRRAPVYRRAFITRTNVTTHGRQS